MQTKREKSREGKRGQSHASVGPPPSRSVPEPSLTAMPSSGRRVSADTCERSSSEPPQTLRRDSSFRLRSPATPSCLSTAELGMSFEADWDGLRGQHELQVHQIELKVQNAELRRTQLELEESRERYFDLYNCAPVGYCTIDEQGRILEANLRAAEMLATSVDTLERQPLTRFILPEDQDIFYLQQRRTFATLGSESFEIRMRQTSGAEMVVWMVLVATLSDVGGQVTVGRVTMSDISLRKRMEQEQQKLQTQLFQAQKLESIGTLAGAIAHDFNNLLASIMANLAILELEKSDQAARAECLDDIKTLAQRGADLTKQLLGFARRGKFEVAPLDFDAVLEKVCCVFERTHKDISMRLERGAPTCSVLADRGQFEQVVLNLLMNAGQAMPGGGELRVATEEVTLSIRDAESHGVRPGSYVKLSVIDNGVGMSEAVRSRIFEPFFTTRLHGGGSGLGLASVYGIIKNHNGFIAVESTLGQGSEFYVYLPTTEREPVLPPVPIQEVPREGAETLLLVDDEEQIIKSWGRTLRHLGYNVLIARNGIEALEILREHADEISLVILDLIMPGMGGKDTFDAMRKLSPGLKVLVWSGYGSDGVASDMMARGCSGFIQKPAGVAALSAKLRELL
jgi:two-component system, cell cycle sensor histidine kinase and response regulator CckA